MSSIRVLRWNDRPAAAGTSPRRSAVSTIIQHGVGGADGRHLKRYVERLTCRTALSEPEQQAILDLPCHTARIAANRDFVGLGERADHASLIVDGLVGSFDQNWQGCRQITAIHIPGDLANLHAVVQPQASSALQTLSVATILRIPHAAIRAATARYPGLVEALWRECMVDAAILSQWAVSLGRRDATSRIAHLLCELATRIRPRAGKMPFSFHLPLTQSHLADATGLTTVHVNRVLKTLRKNGFAEMRKHEVMVLDWDRLVEVAEFDPSYLRTGSRPEERLRIA